MIRPRYLTVPMWVLFPLIFLAAVGCSGDGPRAGTPEGLAERKQRGLLFSRRSPINAIHWTPVKRFTFEHGWEAEQLLQPAGRWTIEDGVLKAVEGPRNRVIMLCPSRYEPVRIEFDARLQPHPQGEARDFTVLVHASADDRFFKSGYTLTTGSYYNNTTCFYRRGQRLARTEYSPLVVNRWYHVTVEMARGHIRYWLDDRILLEAWDVDPLPADGRGWIGLRTWDIVMEVDNVVISEGAY